MATFEFEHKGLGVRLVVRGELVQRDVEQFARALVSFHHLRMMNSTMADLMQARADALRAAATDEVRALQIIVDYLAGSLKSALPVESNGDVVRAALEAEWIVEPKAWAAAGVDEMSPGLVAWAARQIRPLFTEAVNIDPN